MTTWARIIRRALALPRWQAVTCITTASVLGSLLLTMVTLSAFGATQRTILVALAVATIVPALIATPVGLVLTRLLQELDAARGLAQTLANTDALTGVLNRRHFVEKSTQLMGRAAHDQSPTSVLMLDIDDFKTINDRYGHQTGDEVLQMFAAACIRTLRPTDLLARWGGEEFVALLPATAPADAIRISDRLCKAIANGVIQGTDRKLVGVTVSIGVATSPGSGSRLEELLVSADAAMYQAKRAGKNCVRLSA